MKKRASVMVLCTTMAFAVAALVFTPAGQAVANSMQPLLVRVINSSSEPVPVTGTTTIGGTADVNVVSLPAVQAQQSGLWSVDITGTPTVNVANLPGGTPVRDTLVMAVSQPSAESTVLADTVVTDFFGSTFGICVLEIRDTATGALLATHELPNGGWFSLNLTTGLQGPLTLRIEATGLPSVACSGNWTWTGTRH